MSGFCQMRDFQSAKLLMSVCITPAQSAQVIPVVVDVFEFHGIKKDLCRNDVLPHTPASLPYRLAQTPASHVFGKRGAHAPVVADPVRARQSASFGGLKSTMKDAGGSTMQYIPLVIRDFRSVRGIDTQRF